jgi:hypothetical protein
MKHTLLLVVALALAGFSFAAPDVLAADTAKPAPPVVVDAADLVPPVPDPELGLTDKYDGKVVRFTGALRSLSVDKKTKEYQAEMVFEIVHRAKVKGKVTVVGKDEVVVAVTFQNPEKTLLLRFEKEQRAKGPPIQLTVQGKGSVTTDGSLVITDAVTVP